ncbi:serine hydrolase domain-containing protein [Aliiglaciecola litoralis]
MKVLLSFTLFIALSSANTQATNLPSPQQLEQHIKSLVPEVVTDSTPGFVVGVYRGGQLIYGKGFGLANLSYKIPNDISLVYNIGSTTKQFIGYGFAMLHVQGKLDLDTPVHELLDDWPQFEHTVTVRHLLTHTSGYREAYTTSNIVGRYIGVDRLSREECLEVIRRQPKLEFTPGSKFVYNSTAWVVLAEIMEKVTGSAADVWVTENILKPLKMNDTQIETNVGQVIKDGAESYYLSPDDKLINAKSNRAIFGASDIYTNIKDMGQWFANFKSAEVGSEQARELFLTSFQLNSGYDSQYALGIFVNQYKGLKRYTHGGAHEAFLTQFSYFPEHDLGIFIVSNFGRRKSISDTDIADFMLGDFMSEDIQAKSLITSTEAELTPFTGLFVSDSYNSVVKLGVKDNSLMWDGKHQLLQTTSTSFQTQSGDSNLTFSGDSAEYDTLILINRWKTKFNRVEPWEPTSEELKQYSGNYWSKELEAAYEVSVVDQKLKINHRWADEMILKPVTQDFFSNGWLHLRFDRNDNNQIMQISVNSSRTVDIILDKVDKPLSR